MKCAKITQLAAGEMLLLVSEKREKKPPYIYMVIILRMYTLAPVTVCYCFTRGINMRIALIEGTAARAQHKKWEKTF